MTYSALIKNNGASTREKALEERARRLAKRKGYYISKFSSRCRSWDVRGHYFLGAVYGGGNHVFPNIESLIDFLAEEAVAR